MQGSSGFTGSVIDEIHSSDIQGDQMEVKIVLREVSLMTFILQRSNNIKRKVKVALLEVSLMNLILRISKEIKWRGK